ncbi:MAG: hypothetical protein GY820_20085 [Gammaproteobacteria bacterium]|nr:hypothetical protein [Gammaproteobacteria bacterium]
MVDWIQGHVNFLYGSLIIRRSLLCCSGDETKDDFLLYFPLLNSVAYWDSLPFWHPTPKGERRVLLMYRVDKKVSTLGFRLKNGYRKTDLVQTWHALTCSPQ